MGEGVATAVPTASERVSGQAVWSVAAKFATLAGTLGVSVIAARHLGAEGFGTFSFARNLMVYLALLGAFGLDRALLRFVPELEARGSGAGIRRLLATVAGVQALLVAVAGAILVLLEPVMTRVFMPAIGPLLPLVALLAAAWVLKETLYQIQFALARAKVLAMATTTTGATWLALTWWLLRSGWGVAGALAAQVAALAAAAVLLGPSMVRALRALPARSSEGVAGRRVAVYSGTVVGSGLVNLIVQRQSEVFFLAAVAPPAVVGYYDLGYSLPQLGLELVPLSLYAVVLSAVTASYTRNPSRLGHLVGWYYKLLALVTVPAALLGVLWADKALVLLYGPEMAPAGDVARLFSAIHLLPFVSVPVGTALQVTEQAHRTLPLGVAQLGLNLGLDAVLIPRFHIPGAIAAVVLSFLLMTPLTIRYAMRFTGPLEFPFRWMARLALALTPAALPALARPWVDGWLPVAAALAASLLLMALGLRYGGLIGPEERYRLERVHLPGRKWLLAWLVRS